MTYCPNVIYIHTYIHIHIYIYTYIHIHIHINNKGHSIQKCYLYTYIINGVIHMYMVKDSCSLPDHLKL